VLSTTKRSVVLLLAVVALASQIHTSIAHAQATTYRQRLSALQLQNAYQQQQMAVQLAVQQTNLLLQAALRASVAPEPSGFYRPLNFQQQQSALQRALQQTTMLQQTMMRLNNQPSQSELPQLNAIQSALQITSSLQSAAQIQNGPLTTTQIQTLFRVQSSLIGLLASPPPQLSIPGQGR
jgi:hypothetical protein